MTGVTAHIAMEGNAIVKLVRVRVRPRRGARP
jgi:hypothetical protein